MSLLVTKVLESEHVWYESKALSETNRTIPLFSINIVSSLYNVILNKEV